MKRTPKGPDASRLPVTNALWLGARRPFNVTVEDTPEGVDMCLWVESDTGIVRAGTMCPRDLEPDLLTVLLERAMLEPMPGAKPARPKTIAVENPLPSMRKLCHDLGITLVEEADFSPIDELVEGAEDELSGSLDYLVDDTTPREVADFIVAANQFRRAAPWRYVGANKPVRLEGLDAPLNVVILGADGIEYGAVLCLNDAVLSDVLKGRPINADGVPRPLLFFSWLTPDEAGKSVYAQARTHGWKLKDEEPAPLLLTFQHLPDTTPSPEELHLATAALEALAKIPFASGKSLDTSIAVGRRQIQVRWPIAPPQRAMKSGGKSSTAPYLQIRVSLRNTDVWRSIVIADDATMRDLHDAIQNAMGWEDSHLWCIYHDDDEYQADDGDDVPLSSLNLQAKSKLTYTYDFGDDWEHDLKVEKRLAEAVAPSCIGGANACPPEDCGGTNRYAAMLEALKKPRHPIHEEAVERLGKRFDPTKFDLKAADGRMRCD